MSATGRLLIGGATLVALVSTAMLASWATRPPTAPDESDRVAAAQEPLRTPPILQDFDIGGDFELVDHEGREFRLDDQRGRVLLLFFGYTHCPDFCPATLSLLTQVSERLGARAGEVTTLFVSVDPERDTPERLREYLGYFELEALGLTGTEEQLDDVIGAYGGLYEVADATPEGNIFGHSTYTYLIDRAGRVRYLFRPDDTSRFIAAGVLELLES